MTLPAPVGMDPTRQLLSTAGHRRPILAPSSSFHLLGSSPMSPPPTPSRVQGGGGTIRRPPSPDRRAPRLKEKPEGARGDSSLPSSSSSSASTSSMRSPTRSRELEKDSHSRPVARPVARPDKGKGREVISWAEGLDRGLNTMGGRDAGMKLIQYIVRTIVFIARLKGPRRGGFRQPGGLDRLERLDAIQSNISFTRRAFYFASFLGPSLKLARPPKSLASIVPDVLNVWASITDDIWTLHKLGFVGRRIAYPAAEWANRLWLYSIVVGLSHLSLSTPALSRRIAQLEASSGFERNEAAADEEWVMRKQRSVEVWKAVKYWLDLIYVSYDVFHLSRHKDVVQMITGLGASAISVRNSVETQRLLART